MCVIMHFSPGSSMNKEHFFNAVWNNWNGYGIILKDGEGRLQVIKGCPDKGNDPEELWEIVEKHKDIERFVHVRYATKGAIDDTNVQPFQVYNSDKRQVWFMHNGTLNGYGTQGQGQWGKSDTRDFCEKILAPALLRWHGDMGAADYADPVFQSMIVEPKWTSWSKGLFISNDLDPFRIGPTNNGWKEYKHPNETSSGSIWVSNDDYFTKLERGPRFQQLETQRKAEEEARKASEKAREETEGRPLSGTGASSVVSGRGSVAHKLKDWNERIPLCSIPVQEALRDIVETWDVQDPEDMQKLSKVTFEEWAVFADEMDTITLAAFLKCVTDGARHWYNRTRLLEHKHKKATDLIASLQAELEVFKNGTKNKEAA